MDFFLLHHLLGLIGFVFISTTDMSEKAERICLAKPSKF